MRKDNTRYVMRMENKKTAQKTLEMLLVRRAVYIPCLFSYLRRRVDVGCRGDEEGGKIGGKSEGRRGRGKGMEVGGGG